MWGRETGRRARAPLNRVRRSLLCGSASRALIWKRCFCAGSMCSWIEASPASGALSALGCCFCVSFVDWSKRGSMSDSIQNVAIFGATGMTGVATLPQAAAAGGKLNAPKWINKNADFNVFWQNWKARDEGRWWGELGPGIRNNSGIINTQLFVLKSISEDHWL